MKRKRKRKPPILELEFKKVAPNRNTPLEGYGKVQVTFRKRRKINVPTMLGI